MGGGLREIERKFAVDPGFVLPALEQLPGVAAVSEPERATLEAVYYDSDDFRLAQNKITLRRRTGGQDEGWHLKLPLRAGEREEIQRPLGAADTPVDELTPPDGLVDLVRVHLRDTPLRPVARLVTDRTSIRLRDAAGADRAEVVDDQVSAWTLGAAANREQREQGEQGDPSAGAQPAQGSEGPSAEGQRQLWHEIEVEHVGTGDDTSLLDEVGALLTAAGASVSPDASKLSRVLGPALARQPRSEVLPSPGKLRPRSPVGEVVGAYLAAQVQALLAADPHVRLDVPDAVHKMRVATRRFRSTLRTFAPLFDDARAAHLDGELRDLAGALSAARDAEVMVEYFDGRVASLPAELVHGPVAETIDSQLLAGQEQARTEALTMLRSERYLTLVTDLKDLVRGLLETSATQPGRLAAQPARIVLPKLVGRADNRLTRKVNAALATPPGHERDIQLHSARKQAKRLRYAAETAGAVFGPDAAAFARLAEQIQELLGTHQDATIAQGQLRQWGTSAVQAGEPTAFTLGLLLGLEELRARTAERDFIDFWPEASRRRHRRWLQV
ncbi:MULTISPECIES: CYTH and CHAD domain-containing protein [Protofrankia]|uniref:CHAD domain containing protein n=1 Tax=Candidatus Protofrankia datiscae TaxID=2716812 RepID=F8B6C7_9ACTN|nr:MULTISPECIES: CYTH and CHAD domain-containing protein [Protofrankia]AEH08104.1 CHAD domain containing protein [Candidatus Protofrankia datiscae]